MAKKKTTKKTTTKAEATAKKASTKKTSKKKGAAAKETAPTETAKQVYKKIRVNHWRTKLHDEELGVHQKLKYQAKTRMYAKRVSEIIEESLKGVKGKSPPKWDQFKRGTF